MGELQASIEIVACIHKFYNVDLFQRGYYQVRLYLRTSPKLQAKIELAVPNSAADKKAVGIVFPSCVANGSMVSKTFQILYRNEEVQLEDTALFTLHFILESHKVVELLDQADMQLVVELWFTDTHVLPNHHNSIRCVSRRNLQLHFTASNGLHYNLPVMFDYFHLSAVTISIHAVLVAIRQPCVNSEKTLSSRNSVKFENLLQQANLENALFGNHNNGQKCGASLGYSRSVRLAQAKKVHRNICILLMSSYRSLLITLSTFIEMEKDLHKVKSQMPNKLNVDHLSDIAKECYYELALKNASPKYEKPQLSNKIGAQCEEDFISLANNDIEHLCDDTYSLWECFSNIVIGSDAIRDYLAKNHHLLRIKRFSEAFYIIDNPRPSAAGCYDSNYQNYLILSESLRKSKYLNLLPPLPVECVEMDGDASNLPIIFEDQYQNVAEFAKRRSIAKIKLDSQSFNIAKNIVSNEISVPKRDPSPRYMNESVKKQTSVDFELSSVYKANKVRSPLVEQLNQLDLSGQGDPKRKIKNENHNRKATKSGYNGSAQTQDYVDKKDKKSFNFLIDEHVPPFPVYEEDQIPAVTMNSNLPEKEDLTPPLPPRTDKLFTLFKPPLPPKLYKSKMVNNGLKEKLKNNLKLELKLPKPTNNSRTWSKLHVISKPSNMGNRYSSSVKEIDLHSSKDSILLTKYQTVGSSYNMANKTDGPKSGSFSMLPLKHSQSTTSMPAFMSDSDAMTPSDITESLPNLLSATGLSSKRTLPIVSKLEIGLASSEDPTLFQLKKLRKRSTPRKEHLIKTPTKEKAWHNLSDVPLNSSSNSDIMSEQSGWVSNSSRKSSFSSSEVGQEISYKSLSKSSKDSQISTKNTDLQDTCTSSFHSDPFLISDEDIRNHFDKGASKLEVNFSSNNTSPGHDINTKHYSNPRTHSGGKSKSYGVGCVSTLPPPPKEFQDPAPENSESRKSRRFATIPGTSGKVKSKRARDLTRNLSIGANANGNSQLSKNQVKPHDMSYNFVPGESMRRPTKSRKFNSLPSKKSRLNRSNLDKVDKTVHKSSSNIASVGVNKTFPNEKSSATKVGSKVIEDKAYESLQGISLLSPLTNKQYSLLEIFLEHQRNTIMANTSDNADDSKILNSLKRSPTQPEHSKQIKAHQKSKSQPDLNCRVVSSSNSKRRNLRCDTDCDCSLNVKPTVSDSLSVKGVKNLISCDADSKFWTAKEDFKQQTNFHGHFYSDIVGVPDSLPYFSMSEDSRILSSDGLHLIICVHGLDGNSADLRLLKTYLEIGLPGANLDFLMSERNQGDTFSDFETLTNRLVSEVMYHIDVYKLEPARVSFIGHSLGNIIIRGAIAHPRLKPLLPKFYTFLSLSGPHLGTLYNTSGLVNMGMWFMQKWKKSGSLLQLTLKDKEDVRKTFLYKLSQSSHLHYFKNILLCGSSQDRYVPLHSARIELCRQAVKDTSVIGSAYQEMVSNLIQPIISSSSVNLVRFDIHHALASTANSLIGRAAHIAVLDSELFIEKFLLVSGMKYFK